MGLPVTERGGPPGGGGIDRPEALVGGCEGADGGAAGATDAAGASRAAGATGAAGSSEAAGATAGAAAGVAAAGAVVWVVGGAAAGALTAAAGALTAAAGALTAAGGALAAAAGTSAAGTSAAGVEDAGAAGAIGVTGASEAAGAAAGRLAGASAGFSGPGRLVTSLAPDRLIGVGAAGSPSPESVADFEAAAAALPSWSASLPVPVARVVAAAFLAGAFLVAAAFFTGGAGSSGWTSRRRPSRSALRRARSACASSMEDEWLFTPIPRDRHRSSASLLVNPSSCASS